MSPLFSVIIPTYNCAGKIVRAVHSVLAQTHTDYEILVIDDGSLDNTVEVLKPFENLIKYQRKSNGGVSTARNLGIELAKGDYVAFLDADDWWYPTKLQRVAHHIKARPDVCLFYTNLDLVKNSGKKLWTSYTCDKGAKSYLALLKGNYISTSTIVARRDVLMEMGGFDISLPSCEDWDLWIRMARFHPILHIAEVLSAYEYLSDGLSSHTDAWVKAHDKVLDKSFRSDANIDIKLQNRIRGGIEYVKGRIYLESKDDTKALCAFRQSVKLYPFNWRAWIYIPILNSSYLRHKLPLPIKKALRLPEGYV